MKKVMISQPMKGKTFEQIKQERLDIIDKLEDSGYQIVNNIICAKAPDNVDEALFFLSLSIRIMSKVDCLCFMTGWEQARGCMIEHEVAYLYGKEVIYEEELVNKTL